MKKIMKHNFGIFAKLSAAFLLIGLGPLLLFSSFFLEEFTYNVNAIVLNDTGTVLQTAAGYVDAMLSDWDDSMDELYEIDSETGKCMGDILLNEELTQQQKASFIRKRLAHLNGPDGLKSIRFLDKDGNLHYISETVGKVINSAEMEQWKQQELQKTAYGYQYGHEMMLEAVHEDTYFTNINDRVITIRRNLFDVTGIRTADRVLGTIYMDVGEEVIGQRLAGVNLGQRSGFFIIDQYGNEIYKKQDEDSLPAEIRKKLTESAGILQYAAAPGMAVELKDTEDAGNIIQSGEYYYLFQENQPGGWISVIRIYKGDIMENARNTERYILMILMASCLILMIIYFIFSTRISRPIRALKKAMEEIQEGNLDMRVQVDSRDEIGVLADGLNQMASQLNDYISQVYVAGIRQKEAELNALKSQIKPHYLYNTLDVIRMTAMNQGDRKTAEMIECLARQLRYLMGSGDDTVPLQRELDNISDYFKLMSIRYGSRMQLKTSVSGSLRRAEVLKLILQPPIENALKHGLKPKEGMGTVWVSAIRKGDSLEITIMDDGVGMTGEQLEAVRKKLRNGILPGEDPSEGGVGILNVKERICNKYGTEYGLELESMPATGTIVILRIPYIQEEEWDDSTGID